MEFGVVFVFGDSTKLQKSGLGRRNQLGNKFKTQAQDAGHTLPNDIGHTRILIFNNSFTRSPSLGLAFKQGGQKVESLKKLPNTNDKKNGNWKDTKDPD